MLPAATGRRYELHHRKVEVTRLVDLRVHKRPGCWLVSARRIISDVARMGLPVGAARWGRRARALLRGSVCRMVDTSEAAPTLVAAPSQLLDRVGNGTMCLLAIEEEAAMMEVPLVGDRAGSVLGSILLGKAELGVGRARGPLTYL